MSEELEAHIENYADELSSRGMPRHEALRQARVEFGGVDVIKEDCREARGLQLLDDIRRNLTFAFRLLRKSPSFSTIAIISLALGISLNTTAFSIVNFILFHPLPVSNPEQLVYLDTTNPPFLSVPVMSYPDYKDYRDRNDVLSDLIAYRLSPMNLSSSPGTNARLWGNLVSGNYFDALGVSALLGRTFTPSDDRIPGGHPVAVLSYRSWQNRFGADPGIVGKTTKINGLDFTILGVLPAGFHGTEVWLQPEMWIPMMMQAQIEVGNPWLDNRNTWNCWVLGRLKNGVSRSRAEDALNGIAKELSAVHSRGANVRRIRLEPPGLGGTWLRKPILGIAGILFAATVLVLLVACTNIASLLLARDSGRWKEMAVRLALGAGRPQVVRQLLTESLLLAAIGGGLGCVLAYWMIEAVARFPLPVDVPASTQQLVLDYRVLAFAASACLLTGIVFGLAPALHATRVQLVSGLKQESKFRIRRWELRDFLVTAQIALSVLLLTGSVLVFRSVRQAPHLNLGFNPQQVVSLSFDLGLQGYDQGRGRQFQIELLGRIAARTGVESAGLINSLPLSMNQSSTCVGIEGKPQRDPRDLPCVNYYHASPGYFRTMQTRLVAGRDLEMSDRTGSNAVAIVNQAFARQIFGSEDPIGKRIGAPGFWREIVGVVEDGRYVSLGEDSRPVLFYPSLQRYNAETTVVVRSGLPAAQAIELMRSIALELDPNLTLFEVGSVEDHLQFPLAPARIAAGTLSASGLLAVFLAATGIFGMMAYAVACRTREIGIRIAVGATPAGILRLVIARGARTFIAGIVVGGGLSQLAGNYLKAVLYGVSPRDPYAIGGAILLMALAMSIACWVPARRATRIDPMLALRSE